MRTVTYKTYAFKDKDPIIDRMRTAYQDARANDAELRKGGFSEISRRSGLGNATPHNWFDGDTKRPQFASIAAFARSIGYEIAVVKVERTTQKIVQLTPVFSGRSRNVRTVGRR